MTCPNCGASDCSCISISGTGKTCSAPLVCPSCGSTEGCCAAARERRATADSLSRLTERQAHAMRELSHRLADIFAVEPEDAETIRDRYHLDVNGAVEEPLGAPMSAERRAQTDVARLLQALAQVRGLARRPL